MTNERRIDRMNGCVCLGKIILIPVGLFILCLFCFGCLRYCALHGPGKRTGDQRVSKAICDALQNSLENFKTEYNRFPISANDVESEDRVLRSRDSLLGELLPLPSATLNTKHIVFIEPPLARDRKKGIWKDGENWALCDSWGELYYIVLDTNEDNSIANPEFGADQSNSDYAKNSQNYPPPAILPATVIIYSSGPDRDPKTWHDNICSWR